MTGSRFTARKISTFMSGVEGGEGGMARPVFNVSPAREKPSAIIQSTFLDTSANLLPRASSFNFCPIPSRNRYPFIFILLRGSIFLSIYPSSSSPLFFSSSCIEYLRNDWYWNCRCERKCRFFFFFFNCVLRTLACFVWFIKDFIDNDDLGYYFFIVVLTTAFDWAVGKIFNGPS